MARSEGPKPPECLGEAGRDVWIEAQSARWVVDSDQGALLHLCRLEDTAQTLELQIREDGTVREEPIVSPRGETVGYRLTAHPLIAEMRRLDQRTESLRGRLGLDPQGRARMGITEFRNRPNKIDELKAQRDRRRRALGMPT